MSSFMFFEVWEFFYSTEYTVCAQQMINKNNGFHLQMESFEKWRFFSYKLINKFSFYSGGNVLTLPQVSQIHSLFSGIYPIVLQGTKKVSNNVKFLGTMVYCVVTANTQMHLSILPQFQARRQLHAQSNKLPTLTIKRYRKYSAWY